MAASGALGLVLLAFVVGTSPRGAHGGGNCTYTDQAAVELFKCKDRDGSRVLDPQEIFDTINEMWTEPPVVENARECFERGLSENQFTTLYNCHLSATCFGSCPAMEQYNEPACGSSTKGQHDTKAQVKVALAGWPEFERSVRDMTCYDLVGN